MILKIPSEFSYIPPLEPYLQILHRDDDILLLNKPSGLLSVAGRAAEHKDCLEARAQERFANARIVHRLDMSTSGVMVMAMNAAAHKHLGQQFERRKTRKIYIARVWGHIKGDAGCADLPLRCDWPNRPLQMVDHDLGKPAQSEWRILEREDDGHTRVELSPITGRSHQLRVHMLELDKENGGHPILGDDLYAHEAARGAAERLQLHAQSLTLTHPSSGEGITFSVPCPF